MPRGDRTGPLGFGPRTGRAAGFCSGYGVPGYMNPIPGFGYGFGRGWWAGFGRGRGRGFFWGRGRLGPYFNWGYPYYAAYSPVPAVYAYYNQPSAGEEKAFLENETKILKDQLSLLEKRLAELEAEEKDV